MTDQQKAKEYETALKAQLYDMLQMLNNRTSFVRYYYTVMHHFESQTEAFHFVNLQYYLLHDKYLFNTYNAFRLYLKRSRN